VADTPTMTELLFPFSEYWYVYAIFLGLVLAMLVLDLGVFHKNTHAVSFKEAAIWSVVWISLAMVFNWGLYQYAPS
jgi:tellurite resistance protein TerC